MQAYPPTDTCPGGCGKSVKNCDCGKRGPDATVLAECLRAAAHLGGAPGFNWAGLAAVALR
ncbi:hypothetical protein [Streptomonospora wellingtoniae]|uniref:Uncharacterized protein n=1 Tax=Streptomonospora wellingtoniae TaxID=3075544 RepID=A0ABU2KSA3_9ACTN|nr:hypothetical protein [Streptomonospora sp. DSM 45055]MDT0302157.1 hypothetical protein [Streptomonospora sp. DSM 45055]